MFAKARIGTETSVAISPLPEVADAVEVVGVDRNRYPNLTGGRYLLIQDSRTCRYAVQHVREILTAGQPLPAVPLPRRQAG